MELPPLNTDTDKAVHSLNTTDAEDQYNCSREYTKEWKHHVICIDDSIERLGWADVVM